MYTIDRPYNEDKEYFGFKMRTRRRYHDENIIVQCLDEERDVYRMPKEPKCVIDIGANIGCISLVSAKRGSNVIAFEPCNENYETLRYNVAVNGFEDKVKCVQLGVGRPGLTKLYVHPTNSGATSSYLEQRGLEEDKFQEVNFITIKDVFKNYEVDYCDFLKLDCEGSENDIINDFDDELASKVGQISVEFHNKHLVKPLIDKLSQWYNVEHLHRYEYTFRKK